MVFVSLLVIMQSLVVKVHHGLVELFLPGVRGGVVSDEHAVLALRVQRAWRWHEVGKRCPTHGVREDFVCSALWRAEGIWGMSI
jgi:hypothetical protein